MGRQISWLERPQTLLSALTEQPSYRVRDGAERLTSQAAQISLPCMAGDELMHFCSISVDDTTAF